MSTPFLNMLFRSGHDSPGWKPGPPAGKEHTQQQLVHICWGAFPPALNLALGNPKEVPLSSLASWRKTASLSQFSLCYPFHSGMVELRGWRNIGVSTFVLSNYASDWGRGCSQSGKDSSVSHPRRKHLLDTLRPTFIMRHKKKKNGPVSGKPELKSQI